jgi:hypothetical protein
MKILKIFFLIAFLASSIYSDEDYSEKNPSTFDCGINIENSVNINMLIKHNLQNDYHRRNDNFDACLHFMKKYLSVIDNKEDFELNKRGPYYKTKSKGGFKFNY